MKRITAFLCTLSLSLGGLSGCSQNASTTTAPDQTTAAVTTTAETTAEANAETTAPPQNRSQQPQT